MPDEGGRVGRRGGGRAVRTTSKPAAGAALGVLVVTGCGSFGGSDDDATSAATGTLATADTDLGEIVVDAKGRTV
jgi:hypothetical protein